MRSICDRDCRFFEYVHPLYPVLSAQDFMVLMSDNSKSFSLGMVAAIYALAIPFYFLDDELSVQKGYRQPPTEELWQIAERSLRRSSDEAHLELIQLYLLLLLKPPRNFAMADPPDAWAMASSALAAAQSLGLHLDPSEWRLPNNEIRLRRRLWWMVYIEHTWRAAVLGRPSHIVPDNWEVSKLSNDDFDTHAPATLEPNQSIQTGMRYIIALSEITMIVDETLREL